jgi:threonine/homoserine/homoserine lactone efflux protein
LELQHLFLLFGVSIFTAFLASAPVGPVNLWIAQYVIHKENKNVKFFIAGVILADLTYIFLAFWSYFFLSDTYFQHYDKTWGLIGGVLIMGLGLVSLFKNQKKIKENRSQKPSQPWKAFLMGMLLCASNAMLLIMWLFIAGMYASYHLTLQNELDLFWTMCGMVLGDILWFGLFVYILKRGLAVLPTLNINHLHKLIAFALILFGLFTACRQL